MGIYTAPVQGQHISLNFKVIQAYVKKTKIQICLEKLVASPHFSSGGKKKQVRSCMSVRYAVLVLHANILKVFKQIENIPKNKTLG